MVSAVRLLVSAGGLAILGAVLALSSLLRGPEVAVRLGLVGVVVLVGAAMSAALLGTAGRARVALVTAIAVGAGLLVAAELLGAEAAVPAVVALIVVAVGVRLRGVVRALGAHDPDADAWVEEARWGVERSYRNGAIGAAAGTVLIAIAAAALWQPGSGGDAVPTLAAFGAIGAAVGMAVSAPALGLTVQELLGPDAVARRRIARAVLADRPGSLVPAEEPIAARYARVAGRLVVLQVVQSAAFVVGVLPLLGSDLLTERGRAVSVLSLVSVVALVVALGLTVGSIPSAVRRVRRARAFAAAHGGSAA